MSIIETERTVTHWPDGEVELPTGTVARLIYASRCELRGPVLNEMRAIRDHAVVNNAAHGIRVALMNMNGWFVQWIEGAQEGIDGLLCRVSRDPRHRDVMVIHRSEGQPRLFRPWIGSIAQGPESDRQFYARVHAQLERFRQGESEEPSVVWLRLSAPSAPDMPHLSGRNPRAMLLSAQGAQAFGLLEWLARKEQRVLVRRRFAGSADDAPDVESDYADFPDCGPQGLRLVANARKGLAMGMTHAFLPDYAAMVLLLDGSAERNQRLVERVLAASRQVRHTPVIVALHGREQCFGDLQQRVERQGMAWVAAITPTASSDLAEQWQALDPVLQQLR